MSRFLFIATIFLTVSSFGQNTKVDKVYSSSKMQEARSYLIGIYPTSVSEAFAIDTAKLMPFFSNADFITDTLYNDRRKIEIVPIPKSVFSDTINYINKTELYRSICFKFYSPVDSPLTIETQDGRVPAILEAKNEKGNWRPIEFFIHSDCGNSYVNFVVPKQHYAFLKANYYTGDYETVLRLKVRVANKTYFSKEFKGTIAKSKFQIAQNIYDLEPRNDKTKSEIYSRMFLTD